MTDSLDDHAPRERITVDLADQRLELTEYEPGAGWVLTRYTLDGTYPMTLGTWGDKPTVDQVEEALHAFTSPPTITADTITAGYAETEHRRVHAHTPKAHIIRDGRHAQLDAALVHIREANAGSPRAMARLDRPWPGAPWQLRMFALPDARDEMLTDDQVADWGVVIPEDLLEAIYEALALEHGDTTRTAQALQAAEDLLEERDTELREAGQELTERTLERDHWEVLAIAKDELNARVEGHLADVRAALGLERDRTNALTAELFGVREKLERAQAALESLRTPQRVLPGVIHLETTPPDRCAHLSAEGIGGTFQPRRRCTLPKHTGENIVHTDGTWYWDADGQITEPPF